MHFMICTCMTSIGRGSLIHLGDVSNTQYCTYNNKIDSSLSCLGLFWSGCIKEMESGVPLCRIIDAPACSLSKYVGHSVLCLLPCQLLNLILNRNHRMQQLIGLIVTAA